MKKFDFSLKTLHTMKENSEKQQKIEHKSIEAQLINIKQELRAIEAEYEKAKLEFCEKVLKGIEAAHAMQFGEYFLKLKTAIAQKQDSILNLEKEKEKCFELLVNIRTEKMMLEKIRKSEYEAYIDAMKKEHSKVVEDFFSYKVSVS